MELSRLLRAHQGRGLFRFEILTRAAPSRANVTDGKSTGPLEVTLPAAARR
jgi:hypothetical protein